MSYPVLYPGASYRPVVNQSAGLEVPARLFIPHVQEGNGSLFQWFDDPRSQVSSHLWLSKDGHFEQYVPFGRKAWAQAAGNPFCISCECEGFDTEDYTPAQVRCLGEFFAWGVHEFGWRPRVTDDPGGYGIGTHSMGGAAWGGHACPGAVRANRRKDILAVAMTILEEHNVTALLTDDDRKAIAGEVVKQFGVLMDTASSGGQRIADIRHGSGPEMIGIGVLWVNYIVGQVDILRADVTAILAAVRALAEPTPLEPIPGTVVPAPELLACLEGIKEIAGRLAGLTLSAVQPAQEAGI